MAYQEDLMVEATQDFWSTPELEVPATPPDAHRAVITSVTGVTLNNDKRSTKIVILLTSRDVPTVDGQLNIWVPKGYLPSIGDPKFDPRTLPEQEGSKQQTSFRRSFANSDKTAELQKLVFNPDSIARSAGRDPIELGLTPTKPGDFEGYVENLSKMLTGLEVIMLRRERGGDDPSFAHQLEVREIVAADAYDRNPKRFSKYQLAWQE